ATSIPPSRRCRRCSSRARRKREARRALDLAPAAEHETAEREAEPEGAEREPADCDRLAPGGQPLPAAERFLLVRGQRLAAALLAQCTACPQAQVEVVEDLRGVVGHGVHECIASFG